jgi:hypothetical protein
MRRNNKSKFFKDWTNKKLKEEALSYYETIYKIQCYGTKDMLAYDSILNELAKRGIEFEFKLKFNK